MYNDTTRKYGTSTKDEKVQPVSKKYKIASALQIMFNNKYYLYNDSNKYFMYGGREIIAVKWETYA